MPDRIEKKFYRYWGKANPSEESGVAYHLLPYHCLDVAAMGCVWWKNSEVMRSRFVAPTGLEEPQVRAWVLFFITLHDLGKYDVRFQLKAREVALSLWVGFARADARLSRNYYHGDSGFLWIYEDLSERFSWKPTTFWDAAAGEETWKCWAPWIQAVAGHHGVLPSTLEDGPGNFADQAVIESDKEARLAFISEMEALFLKPAGLSLDDSPPAVNGDFLAGFCAVCDWLGSGVANSRGQDRFVYVSQPEIPLNRYFESRLPIAEEVLTESGLIQQTTSRGGMQSLFPDKEPRQVQTLVDDLPQKTGFTLIEAPTGSGKTEAALAYASRLMAQGLAESIIFALPTQATANAMLTRLIEVSKRLYAQSNLVLAHGKARFHEVFIDLKKNSQHTQPQDAVFETEASVQCSQWLSQSRKRVFLGQIGVCTVDQVLISALPVKHQFVRSFGLGKSILIVDEVHAYDSYMYGLLESVLQRQKKMGGSAILMSATLPQHQRQSLIAAWEGNSSFLNQKNGYPLITHVSGPIPKFFTLPAPQQQALEQKPKQVNICCRVLKDMVPDEALLNKIIQAAEAGANVVLICNLVVDVQKTAERLREMSDVEVDLFHSRFRFKDRQAIETNVLSAYGNGDQRKRGGILISTQVVEQSLDLDFDWMITQLCPIDLFFQRLGRLHRHELQRPEGFESAKCTVILPEKHDYKLHALIYGMEDAPNTRVLWRTERLLSEQKETVLSFPQAYRPMIERVYQEDPWGDEPDEIREAHEKFEMHMEIDRMTARSLSRGEAHFEDSDASISKLTRDGEMNLNVVPVTGKGKSRSLLDGKPILEIEEWRLIEEINMNTVPVPASWAHDLPCAEDGVIWLSMTADPCGLWFAKGKRADWTYSLENGLERMKHESTD